MKAVFFKLAPIKPLLLVKKTLYNHNVALERSLKYFKKIKWSTDPAKIGMKKHVSGYIFVIILHCFSALSPLFE